jgi:hypothetical protein
VAPFLHAPFLAFCEEKKEKKEKKKTSEGHEYAQKRKNKLSSNNMHCVGRENGSRWQRGCAKNKYSEKLTHCIGLQVRQGCIARSLGRQQAVVTAMAI